MLCPIPSRCQYDDFLKAGVHFCTIPVCQHLRLQRKKIGKRIAGLMLIKEKSKKEAEELVELKRQYAITLKQEGSGVKNSEAKNKLP